MEIDFKKIEESVYRQFEENFSLPGDETDGYTKLLLAMAKISAEITANSLKMYHEQLHKSPQSDSQ